MSHGHLTTRATGAGDYNVMVMDILGPSLEDLFHMCGQHFSLKTVLMLADQCLRRLEYVHAKNFIHRDVKPDNFLMGVGNRSTQVYLIDFGLAKKYRDSTTHQHIPYRENKSLTGTARYASNNTHLGIEQSRRDDLESLGYILMYFCRGSLPWQGQKADNKHQKYEKIAEKKLSTTVEQLCKGYPSEFATFLTYCKSLHFEDKPDYEFLRKLLRGLFAKEGYKYDAMYDWILIHLSNKASPEKPRITSRDQEEIDTSNATHAASSSRSAGLSTSDPMLSGATRHDSYPMLQSTTPPPAATAVPQPAVKSPTSMPSASSPKAGRGHATHQHQLLATSPARFVDLLTRHHT
eukprot:TRINITY_DN779_c0_g3_i1.p1 TRINITY_DN779_c0_g3~~TRINITY_DN779_c0_g3_i1.p1  ORF type:complete len:349 (+),score=66.27 TRINITY_DN779_c0_g3_i1:331-1377(+)